MNDVWTKFHGRPSLHLLILVFVGYQAFVSNISLSLFAETEGLYAIVTHTMMAAGDYVHLSLRGEPYFNKPPLFFWLQALGAHALGWSEVALRLPSALASFGTILATYGLGRILFSPVAGFWAALTVTTCYAALWFGPLAIIDPLLTFCMTLGMYAWARAYFQKSSQSWYLVAFAALAVGAMVKTLHAFAMPALVVSVFLWIRRDSQPFREPWFWAGFVFFGVLLGGYYGLLGQQFWQHFFFEENLQRLVAQVGDEKRSAFEAYWGKRPIQWYGYVIWFDAFPWSVILPTGLVLLWKQRPWRQASRELWVLLWVGGYLLAFSLVPEKHERYLLPLLPGIGLVVGYVYQYFCVDRPQASGQALLTWMLGLLGVAFGVAVFLGPILLQKKWFLPVETIPLAVRVGFGIGGLTLLILAIRNKIRLALLGVGVLGVGLMLAVTVWIIPGIHAEGAPKSVFLENQQRLSHPTDPIRMFQTRSWRGDEDEFYWDVYHGHFQVVGEGLEDSAALKALKQELRAYQNLVIMMTEEQYNNLIANDHDFFARIDLKFHRSRKQIYLVSLQEREATL